VRRQSDISGTFAQTGVLVVQMADFDFAGRPWLAMLGKQRTESGQAGLVEARAQQISKGITERGGQRRIGKTQATLYMDASGHYRYVA